MLVVPASQRIGAGWRRSPFRRDTTCRFCDGSPGDAAVADEDSGRVIQLPDGLQSDKDLSHAVIHRQPLAAGIGLFPLLRQRVSRQREYRRSQPGLSERSSSFPFGLGGRRLTSRSGSVEYSRFLHAPLL